MYRRVEAAKGPAAAAESAQEQASDLRGFVDSSPVQSDRRLRPAAGCVLRAVLEGSKSLPQVDNVDSGIVVSCMLVMGGALLMLPACV